MLQALTHHKKDKINHAIKTMGTPDSLPTVLDGIQRNIVRGFINGLGFESQSYIGLNYQELTNVYRAFGSNASNEAVESLQSLIRSAGANGMTEEIQWGKQAHEHYRQATGASYTPVTTTPTPPAIDWAGTPNPTPATPPVITPGVSLEQAKALEAIMAIFSKPQVTEMMVDESKVIELIKKHAVATKIEVKQGNNPVKTIEGLHHKVLPDLITMLSTGVNVMMVGPAGSGKTTLGHQCAEALSIPFYFNGALSSEYKLSGFVDAQGRIVSTAFRKAYETGGLYLFDEIDASMPDALLAFNAALANGHADFPDGMIPRHESFSCMAAANTFGRGADRIYVGRNQLDGASLDRFCVVNVDYDEKLERVLANDDGWTDYVQGVRKAVFDLKLRHVVSPRASINGALLLKAGMKRDFVEESTLWKGLDKDTKAKIKQAV